MKIWIAEFAGYIGLALYILSYQCRCSRKTMLIKAPGGVAYALTYLLYGSLIGAVISIVAVIRDVGAYAFSNKNHYSMLALFMICVWTTAYTTIETAYDFLPPVAATFATVGLLLRDTFYRFRLLFSCSLLCWLVYGVHVSSPSCISYGFLCLGSNITCVLRQLWYDRKVLPFRENVLIQKNLTAAEGNPV